jgi:hypothetical protein
MSETEVVNPTSHALAEVVRIAEALCGNGVSEIVIDSIPEHGGRKGAWVKIHCDEGDEIASYNMRTSQRSVRRFEEDSCEWTPVPFSPELRRACSNLVKTAKSGVHRMHDQHIVRFERMKHHEAWPDFIDCWAVWGGTMVNYLDLDGVVPL